MGQPLIKFQLHEKRGIMIFELKKCLLSNYSLVLLHKFLVGKINRKIQIKWNLNLTNYTEMVINSF